MNTDRLVTMANQIATAFRHYPSEEAVTGAANHMVTFWEARMQHEMRAYLAAGGEGLSDLARAAIRHIEEAKQEPIASEEAMVTSNERAPARNVEGNPIPAENSGSRSGTAGSTSSIRQPLSAYHPRPSAATWPANLRSA